MLMWDEVRKSGVPKCLWSLRYLLDAHNKTCLTHLGDWHGNRHILG